MDSLFTATTICTLLQMDLDQYINARNGLIDKDLIAFDGTVFQVLELPASPVFRQVNTKTEASKESGHHCPACRPVLEADGAMMDDTLIALDQAIQDYLEWMAVNGYAKSTQQDHKRTLRHFRLFINQSISMGRYFYPPYAESV
jgi:hypothetical protein